ncbi:MAG: winged helix-turn-helix transcriptional regulator [Actinobacteria bacterium]|nr:winged helix-turn-helix transcriptional regulator [Actinomycetota bacterium]
MVDQLSGLDSTPHLLATLTLAERRIGEAIAARSQSGDVVTRGSHARLLHLVPPEGARQSELAEGWISKQAVGKRVQEMVAAGLLAVEPDPDDGRATIVRRTTEGDRILVLITQEMAEFEAELAARVGARRYRTFRAVLDELATP